jgi:hydroxypyruvate reductase
LEVLEAGDGGRLPETPKSSHPAFTLCDNVLVGGNADALAAAAAQARALGYETTILSSDLEGEARTAAQAFVRRVQEGNSGRPQAFLAGGETTVTVTGKGIGGRNQEITVGFARALHQAGLRFEGAFLSGATDGGDGPTDAAGGLIDRESWLRLVPLAEQALADNDTYHALEAAGGLLKTGSTGTNVCDLQILLLG